MHEHQIRPTTGVCCFGRSSAMQLWCIGKENALGLHSADFVSPVFWMEWEGKCLEFSPLAEKSQDHWILSSKWLKKGQPVSRGHWILMEKERSRRNTAAGSDCRPQKYAFVFLELGDEMCRLKDFFLRFYIKYGFLGGLEKWEDLAATSTLLQPIQSLRLRAAASRTQAKGSSVHRSSDHTKALLCSLIWFAMLTPAVFCTYNPCSFF